MLDNVFRWHRRYDYDFQLLLKTSHKPFKLDFLIDFKYVINPPKIPKVVFGSGLERVTLPLSGPCMSSFMRKTIGNADRSPGPAACVDEKDYMIKKVRNVQFGYKNR